MSDEKDRKKPGPETDRLVGKQPEAETHHNWRRLDRYDIVTTYGMPSGVKYRCRVCGHYARSNSVPGPCPPPDGSPKLLD